jgi:hypothetical protein
MKAVAALGAAVTVAAVTACGTLDHPATMPQSEPASTGQSAPTSAPATAPGQEDAAAGRWSFAASVYTYFVPDDRNYVAPTFTADRDWLHLEARYNYEDVGAGSVFAGYNLSVEEEVTVEVTPMLGVVFGHTTGIAPGYRFSLSFWKLDLFSEGEYVFDLEDSSDNFFYTWSELGYSPTDWLRLGIVAQRTRAYESDLDIQRGLLLGVSYKALDVTAYLFNLGWDDPSVVFSFGTRF